MPNWWETRQIGFAMKMVIIEVSGGVVQEIYSDSEEIAVMLVDWDNIEAQASGTKCVHLPCCRLAEMPTSTRNVVDSKPWIK